MTTLRNLKTMTVRVTEKGSNFVAPVDGWSEELGSSRAQHLVSCLAVRHPDDQLIGDRVTAGWRGKGHGGLVFCRIASNGQHDFTSSKMQEAQGIGNLTND